VAKARSSQKNYTPQHPHPTPSPLVIGEVGAPRPTPHPTAERATPHSAYIYTTRLTPKPKLHPKPRRTSVAQARSSQKNCTPQNPHHAPSPARHRGNGHPKTHTTPHSRAGYATLGLHFAPPASPKNPTPSPLVKEDLDPKKTQPNPKPRRTSVAQARSSKKT
jgi:hypothetical protein